MMGDGGGESEDLGSDAGKAVAAVSATPLFLVCCTIGAVLSFTAVSLGVLATGQQWQAAVAVGLFTAIWGGLGFGSMIGGVIYATRLERHG